MRFITLCFGLAATTAQADVDVVFREGAPKDAFTFVSTDACLNGPVQITVDLSGSGAGLIFDVSEQGQGVEVFQPFELVAGGDLVVGASQVNDGDTSLTLVLRAMPAGQQVGFTIDLDDTIGAREITVSGAEIAGAAVMVSMGDMLATGVFGEDARASIAIDNCTS